MDLSKWFRFQPTRELIAVFISWILVVSVFYTAFQIFTTQRVALNFITFGVIGITMFGIALPVIWTVIIKKRPFSAIGITRDKLLISLLLGVLFSIAQYFMTIRNIEVPEARALIPLIAMALAVGLYENIFYRGWVQLRMEEFFGLIPSVILSAVIYAIYHIGYGMPLSEMRVLFVVGLVYSIIFRITSNIFILYPLLTPTGALFTQIKDGLELPFEATLGFADVLILCVVTMTVVYKLNKKTRGHLARGPLFTTYNPIARRKN